MKSGFKVNQLLFLMLTFQFCSCGSDTSVKSLPEIHIDTDTVEKPWIWSADSSKTAFSGDFFRDSVVKEVPELQLDIHFSFPNTSNSYYKKAIDMMYAEFMKDIEDFEKVSREIMENETEESAQSNYLEISPVMLYSGDGKLSFLFYVSQMSVGAAHPLSGYYSFNYDLVKDRKIKFYDYFITTSSREQQQLLDEINAQLKDKEKSELTEFRNFDFNFTDKKLFFNFSDYDLGSYAEGMERVEFYRFDLDRFAADDYHVIEK